jgi:DNA-binding transcriptional LysR family regulator
MELREMKSLIALSECGSIQEVGLRCNLSPAAVHKHLKILESEFDVQLYTKKNGRLALTEPGLILVPFFRDIILRCGAAQVALEEWKGVGRGLVRIGAGPAFSSYLLPALVKRFRRRFPNIDVFIETGDSDHLITRVKDGSLDLAFDLAVAAAQDENLQQLAAWESEAGFISHLAGLDFHPNTIMRSDSAEAIKAMVRAGLGISLLFLWNIGAESQKSGFTIIQTEAPPLISRIALIRLRGDYIPRAVSEFVTLAHGLKAKHFRPVHVS